MATVDELETAATQWLNNNRGKLSLQRDLYLVTGFDDETAGCWVDGANAIAKVWGPRVFSNWHVATASIHQHAPDPTIWKFANVRVIDFDLSYRRSFLEFGDVLRKTIQTEHPDTGSSMGKYDLVGHSMGGLDSFVALLDLTASPNPVPAADRIARAYNLVTMDTPYRGIPNWEARRNMSPASKRDQCTAMAPDSPELKLIDANASRLPSRVVRMTCYGVDSASQVEVTSGNLFADKNRYAAERDACDYRFFQIPGASHSGPMGITQSVITIANLFHTLTTSRRLST